MGLQGTLGLDLGWEGVGGGCTVGPESKRCLLLVSEGPKTGVSSLPAEDHRPV